MTVYQRLFQFYVYTIICAYLLANLICLCVDIKKIHVLFYWKVYLFIERF